MRRFVLGLGKKVLIANTLGRVADQMFALPAADLTTPLAWLGLVCYTLQIYFDFSGYSDMAIGLMRMFGFRILENFNYPYIAQSIREFWRRWHISLSNWFRDYLYIPLGGNQRGTARAYANLVIVFLLCGLWHGASWPFVIWGVWHGLFLVAERAGLDRVLARIGPLRHAYALAAVMGGWVLFRCDTLTHAIGYYAALAGRAAAIRRGTRSPNSSIRWWRRRSSIAVVGATPVARAARRMARARAAAGGAVGAIVLTADVAWLALVGARGLRMARRRHLQSVHLLPLLTRHDRRAAPPRSARAAARAAAGARAHPWRDRVVIAAVRVVVAAAGVRRHDRQAQDRASRVRKPRAGAVARAAGIVARCARCRPIRRAFADRFGGRDALIALHHATKVSAVRRRRPQDDDRPRRLAVLPRRGRQVDRSRLPRRAGLSARRAGEDRRGIQAPSAISSRRSASRTSW